MRKEVIDKVKRFMNGAVDVAVTLIDGAVAIVIGLAGIIKRNKFMTIAIVTTAILLGWLLSTVIVRSYVWNQEVKDRIEIEISKSGLNFNRTRPGHHEYRFEFDPTECTDEKDWETVNATLQEVFEYMKNLPNGSILYKYELGFKIYIGYTYDSLTGTRLIGYNIYTSSGEDSTQGSGIRW